MAGRREGERVKGGSGSVRGTFRFRVFSVPNFFVPGGWRDVVLMLAICCPPCGCAVFGGEMGRRLSDPSARETFLGERLHVSRAPSHLCLPCRDRQMAWRAGAVWLAGQIACRPEGYRLVYLY